MAVSILGWPAALSAPLVNQPQGRQYACHICATMVFRKLAKLWAMRFWHGFGNSGGFPALPGGRAARQVAKRFRKSGNRFSDKKRASPLGRLPLGDDHFGMTAARLARCAGDAVHRDGGARGRRQRAVKIGGGATDDGQGQQPGTDNIFETSFPFNKNPLRKYNPAP